VKPGRFSYHAPESLPEALELLSQNADSKVIAGGQSLMPLLNFRMASPEHLIDINRLPGLDTPVPEAGGWHIPALVRQRAVERSAELGEAFPLLRSALSYVAHPQIRNRGTVCGSLAHADPSAEMPTVITALGATLHAASERGERTVHADDFFLFHFTTALEEDELLTGVTLPHLPPGTRTAFAEFAPRRGDFGLAGVAGVVTRDESGVVTGSRLFAAGVGATPHRLVETESVIAGERLTPGVVRAANDAAAGEVDPGGDIHASARYRKHLVGSLAGRVLTSVIEEREVADV
jgi:aerobic carbon-monoxide dehydrogenase medium subunit